MNLTQTIGHRDALIAERRAILANVSPRHRWRILGVRWALPPVTHAITVDLRKPEARKIERVDPPAAKRPLRPEYAPIHRVGLPSTSRHVLRIVAEAYGITVYDLCSPSRLRRFAWPRFAAMALLYSLPGWSSKMVARALGGRDHSTILSGVKSAAKLHAENAEWRQRYDAAHAALRVSIEAAGGTA